MPTYDVACVARRQASNKKMNKLTSRLAKDLKKRGGVIRKISHYGQRPLAYPINRKGQKHDVGRYTRFFVQTSPQGLKEFLSTLRLDEDVIRYKPFKMTPNEFLELGEKPAFKHKPQVSEAHYDALRRTTNINYYIARTLLLQGKMTVDQIQALGTHEVKFEPYFKSREQDLAERVFDLRKISNPTDLPRGDYYSDISDTEDQELKSLALSHFSDDFSTDSDFVSSDAELTRKDKRVLREYKLRAIRNQFLSDPDLRSSEEEFVDRELKKSNLRTYMAENHPDYDVSSEELNQILDKIDAGSDSESATSESDSAYRNSVTPKRRVQTQFNKSALYSQIDDFTELSEDKAAIKVARKFNNLHLSGSDDFVELSQDGEAQQNASKFNHLNLSSGEEEFPSKRNV